MKTILKLLLANLPKMYELYVVLQTKDKKALILFLHDWMIKLVDEHLAQNEAEKQKVAEAIEAQNLTNKQLTTEEIQRLVN